MLKCVAIINDLLADKRNCVDSIVLRAQVTGGWIFRSVFPFSDKKTAALSSFEVFSLIFSAREKAHGPGLSKKSYETDVISRHNNVKKYERWKILGVFVHFIENDSTVDWEKNFSLTQCSQWLMCHLNASLSTRKQQNRSVESASRTKIKGTAHPQCRHIIDVKRRKKLNVNPSGLGWITRLKDTAVQ